RGERLRRREEEREAKRAAKRVKLGKCPKAPGRSDSHEDRGKKRATKRRLEVARLGRLVAKQEELLGDYHPPKVKEVLDPELKRKVSVVPVLYGSAVSLLPCGTPPFYFCGTGALLCGPTTVLPGSTTDLCDTDTTVLCSNIVALGANKETKVLRL
ncbi:unnamed protein product, partial [Choristocarpus tenellus]